MPGGSRIFRRLCRRGVGRPNSRWFRKVIVTTAADRLLRPDPPLRRDSTLAIGPFAPSLLLASAVDVSVGPEIGDPVRKHDDRKLGALVEEYLQRRCSVIVVSLKSRCLSGVAVAFSHPWKSTSATMYWDDYRTVDGVISKAGVSALDGSRPGNRGIPTERTS